MAMALLAGSTIESVNANEFSNADLTLEQISNYSSDSNTQGQVTSVNQLSDVSPTDWAYEALRSLVERYGCIVGYPDRTFRGNRALSRFEFAAGLNACMQSIERLIGTGGVTEEDIAALRRLIAEFETELAALGARVDNLEGRVAFLEDNQFSTTTKLSGEVLFGLVAQNNEVGGQATFSNRARLSLDTSFTGRDRLRTRLAAGNVPGLQSLSGSDMTRLSFAQNTGNNVVLDKLFYSTPLGERSRFVVGTSFEIDDVFDTYTPFTSSGGAGALARGTRYNPFIYRQNSGGGLGFKFQLSDQFDISTVYLAGDASNPESGNGLFNGDFSAGVQLGFNPSSNFGLALSYMRSYFADTPNLTGSTGSPFTNRPFGNVPTTSDNFGVQTSWRVSPNVNVAGWVGFANADAQDGSGANADLFTWNANVSFIDVLREGAVLTVAGGQPPRVTGGTFGSERDSSFILEGQYRYPITRNVSITPGVYAIFNPNHDSRNGTEVVGVLRTRFAF
ncbi:cyanobacterial porin [Cyanobacterium stanieri PCC 7202]|uniref:Cyanobacterial porin n=1 Tax=Cyanobacterium stanieri (strain ATCC 29140 / PCC 7202) TaxID=292563 RepID=K9YMQ2_CYASC|nr:cyanobacterial porin [Cyanobacterium stanieri PCC 7202]